MGRSHTLGFAALGLALSGALGCAGPDEGFDRPPVDPEVIHVVNKSQFDYHQLFVHADPLPDLDTLEGQLEAPLKPGEALQLVAPSGMYFSATRPRVARGPTLVIRTEEPVDFYDTRPQLWIVDLGFIVLD